MYMNACMESMYGKTLVCRCLREGGGGWRERARARNSECVLEREGGGGGMDGGREGGREGGRGGERERGLCEIRTAGMRGQETSITI